MKMKTLRSFFRKAQLIIVALMFAMLLCSQILPIGIAKAATPNPSTASPGYFVMPLHFDSQLTATVADKAQWTMPWPAQLVQMTCVARALGGSASPTYTFTLQSGATNLATCAMVTAGTVVEGTISTSAVADETNMTLDYASTGTSPTADDV